MPCRKFALCSSRNRFSRVPLSVKRTVPPQLSATASLPLPAATVGVSPSTAVPGKRDERNGFPRRFAPRNDNTRELSAVLSFRASPQAGVGIRTPHIVAAQRAAPTFCGALHRKRRDLIIAHPTGREFPKGEGAHALSLWTLQGEGIFKGRGKFGIPLPLNGVFGYFCRCWQK